MGLLTISCTTSKKENSRNLKMKLKIEVIGHYNPKYQGL
jgi:hypothetical protein